jgi:hypothetical protein
MTKGKTNKNIIIHSYGVDGVIRNDSKKMKYYIDSL